MESQYRHVVRKGSYKLEIQGGHSLAPFPLVNTPHTILSNRL